MDTPQAPPGDAIKPVRRKKRSRASDTDATDASDFHPMAPDSFYAQMINSTVSVKPNIRLIEEMTRAHPHTAMDTGCLLALNKQIVTSDGYAQSARRKSATLSAAAVGTKMTSENDATPLDAEAEQHLLHSQIMPAPLVRLIELYQRFMRPAMRIEDQTSMPSANDADHMLRVRSQCNLPLYTAHHETFLLRQSGHFTFIPGAEREEIVRTCDASDEVRLRSKQRYFPPCMKAESCYGCTLDRGTGVPANAAPLVMMRAMSVVELNDLMVHDIQPTGASPCVLCHRQSISEWIHHYRLLFTSAQHGEGSSKRSKKMCEGWTVELENSDEVAQLWRNRIDEADGYFSSYVMMPREEELIVAPIADFTPSLLVVEWHGAMAFVNQSAMLWRPKEHLVPHVGEKLEVFWPGASCTINSRKGTQQSSERELAPVFSRSLMQPCSAPTHSSLFCAPRTIISDFATALPPVLTLPVLPVIQPRPGSVFFNPTLRQLRPDAETSSNKARALIEAAHALRAASAESRRDKDKDRV